MMIKSVLGFFVSLITVSRAFGAEPLDPVFQEIRSDFGNSRVPAQLDFHLGATWTCLYRSETGRESFVFTSVFSQIGTIIVQTSPHRNPETVMFAHDPGVGWWSIYVPSGGPAVRSFYAIRTLNASQLNFEISTDDTEVNSNVPSLAFANHFVAAYGSCRL